MTKSRKLWLQLIAVAALSGTLAGGIIGYLSTHTDTNAPKTSTRPDDTEKRVIDTRYIKHLLVQDIGVLDSDRNVTMTITSSIGEDKNQGPGICLYQDGTRRMSMEVYHLQDKAPSLSLYNAQGDVASRLAVLPDGQPTFLMSDPVSGQVYFIVNDGEKFRSVTGTYSDILSMARKGDIGR